MTDLVIKSVNLMTMSNDISANYGLVENAAIAVAGGKISWIGSQQDAPEAGEVIDGNGQYLSPGLVDCHSHLVFAGSRAHEFEQRLTGVSYEEIAKQGGGILSTVKATREASFEQLLELALQRANQLLSEGVTSLEIKSGYGLDTETEIKMLKVARAVGEQLPINVKTTFLGAHALPTEYKGKADDYIDLICEDMLPN